MYSKVDKLERLSILLNSLSKLQGTPLAETLAQQIKNGPQTYLLAPQQSAQTIYHKRVQPSPQVESKSSNNMVTQQQVPDDNMRKDVSFVNPNLFEKANDINNGAISEDRMTFGKGEMHSKKRKPDQITTTVNQQNAGALDVEMESCQPSAVHESHKKHVGLDGPTLTLLDQSMEKLSIESK